MKKILLCLVLIIMYLSVLSQDKYIYDEYGKKYYFIENPNTKYVKFENIVTNNYKRHINVLSVLSSDIDTIGENFYKIKIGERNILSFDDEIRKMDSVLYSNELIYTGDSTIQCCFNTILLRIKDNYEILTELHNNGISYRSCAQFGFYDNEYLLTLKNNEAMEVANALFETGKFIYAVPSFYRFNVFDNPYYPLQWGLKNTGQNEGIVGVDIKAESAWSYSSGVGVKIAVVDNDIQLDHPDLQGNLLQDFDTTVGIDDGSSYHHGTRCAGIIAACDNNLGVKGIAYNSKIIPIKISFGDCYEDENVIEAFEYALNAGADIISCSWGGGSPSPAIKNVIDIVSNYGRNGLGCPILFSSGNKNKSTINMHASLSNTIAVGAISPCGERKSPISCDGESHWGSNYGNGLDVVAPGVLIPTTTFNDSYILNYNGTSAACPHVAGVAALMLSVNSNLTRLELTDIIRRTAQKVGGYDYQMQNNDPQMTWCPETGYGLIDAHMAVVESMLYGTNPTLNGNREMYLCDSYTFSCDIINPDAFSYEWTYSDNLVALPSNDNTINVKPIRPGSAWVKVNVYSENRLIRTLEINDIAVDNSSYNDGLVPLSHSLLNFTHNTTLSEDNHYLVLDAVVEEDVTLTITGTVYCSDIASIKIKPGGKLIIDGGELTSVCSDKQWQGIEVWGVDSLHQNLSNGQYYQGILELKNGATIENAICAVDLWNPLDEHSEGGIVWAEDAVFRNNDKAVRAINYSNYNPSSGVETHNASHFRNCSFIVDSDYSGNNTFNSHVELNNIDGIKFYSCYFSVDDSISQQTSFTSAIYASSAGFTVTSECSLPLYPCPEENLQRSVFDGFDNAIYVTNNGASVRTFTVSGAEFRNNQRCIYANNTGYATIIKNNFYVGSNSLYNYGVYIENVMNFCIEENNFTSTKKANSYGLIVLNSPSYNEIYLNHFYNLHYGNIAGGLNVSVRDHDIGLTYICNTNEGNTNDFGVTLYNRQAYIRLYQGSSTIAASNTFSATNYHFYNEGGYLIKYFYNGVANRPTRVSRVSSIAAVNKHECESHYDVVIGGGGGVVMSVGKTDSLKNKYENALMSINRLKGLNAYKIEKDTTQRIRQESQMSMLRRECLLAAGDIVRSNLNKEERDFNELREWMEKNDDISSDRMIIASYIQQKDFDNAIALAKTLPATYNLQGAELDEHLDYMEIISLHESLYETQRSIKQLTDYEKAMLEDMSENGVGGSQLMARSILDESRGTPTIIISSCPTIPTYGATARGESEEITEPTSDNGLKVEVSPNPATSSVEISYVLPEKEKTATFVLTNTLGVNVLTTELEGNNGAATINLDNIPSGIYFYTVRSGDDVMTGKLVVE